mmetsp:Transcript_22959/g.58420  ORF Transcript_22959/g.58420 Transcript_22959/m.58420 type:complete len:228 (-) Transcript_22959:180-863(-)
MIAPGSDLCYKIRKAVRHLAVVAAAMAVAGSHRGRASPQRRLLPSKLAASLALGAHLRQPKCERPPRRLDGGHQSSILDAEANHRVADVEARYPLGWNLCKAHRRWQVSKEAEHWAVAVARLIRDAHHAEFHRRWCALPEARSKLVERLVSLFFCECANTCCGYVHARSAASAKLVFEVISPSMKTCCASVCGSLQLCSPTGLPLANNNAKSSCVVNLTRGSCVIGD